MDTFTAAHDGAEDWGLEPPCADAFDDSDLAVYTTDPEGWITYYNEAAAALWGRRPVIGQERWCGSWRCYDALGAVQPPEAGPMATALRCRREVTSATAVIERPDGTRVAVALNPAPLLDGDGRMVAASNVLVPLVAPAALPAPARPRRAPPRFRGPRSAGRSGRGPASPSAGAAG